MNIDGEGGVIERSHSHNKIHIQNAETELKGISVQCIYYKLGYDERWLGMSNVTSLFILHGLMTSCPEG